MGVTWRELNSGIAAHHTHRCVCMCVCMCAHVFLFYFSLLLFFSFFFLQLYKIICCAGHFTRTDEDKWVLPSEGSVLESPPSTPAPPPSHPFVNWQQYYAFRELPLHSPVAAILTYPMTLYYIVTTLLRKDGECLISSAHEL